MSLLIVRIVQMNGEVGLVLHAHFLNFFFLEAHVASSHHSSIHSFAPVLDEFCLRVLDSVILRLKSHFRVELSFIYLLEISAHAKDLIITLEHSFKPVDLRPNFLVIKRFGQLILALRVFLLEDLTRGLQQGELGLKLAFELVVILIVIIDLVIVAINLVSTGCF